MKPPVFFNGREYAFWAQYCPPFCLDTNPPHRQDVPWVEVRMKRHGVLRQFFSCGFKPVAGKVDTGADRTVLHESTAIALGIKDFASGVPHQMQTTTDQDVEGYLHPVLIQLAGCRPNGRLHNLSFRVEVVVCPTVKRNLFGRDWLQHVCIAMDHKSAHFLAG